MTRRVAALALLGAVLLGACSKGSQGEGTTDAGACMFAYAQRHAGEDTSANLATRAMLACQ